MSFTQLLIANLSARTGSTQIGRLAMMTKLGLDTLAGETAALQTNKPLACLQDMQMLSHSNAHEPKQGKKHVLCCQ